MNYHLIVTTPWGDYQRGERITDPAKVQAILAEHHDKVVRVAAPASKE